MKNDSRFKGLIFDFNGVLWWDARQQEDSWCEFSGQLRPEPLSDDEFLFHVHGRNGIYTLEYLTGQPVSAEEAARMMEEKEIVYRQMCLDLGADFCLSPGATQLLDFLVERDIPHTIATASGRPNVDFFIEQLSLETWFDVDRIVYDDGTMSGKPAPDLYLRAARYLGLEPSSCVVIEDSHSGIQAAHAAGIGHIIALGPVENHAELTDIEGVGEVIENLAQVRRNELF